MEHLKNNWTIFLASIFIVLSLLLVSQCHAPQKKQPEWRYEVHGYVIYKGEKRDAIWFTDTLEFGENYLRYENSDGSEVIIPSPYVLIDHKYNKVIKDTTSAF